jgi:hypothetical protein
MTGAASVQAISTSIGSSSGMPGRTSFPGFKLGKDVIAIGMTSGNPYTLKGKGTIKSNWVPNNPAKAIDHTGTIGITPADPITPGNPVRVHIHVDYDGASNVTASAIDFPSGPVLNT